MNELKANTNGLPPSLDPRMNRLDLVPADASYQAGPLDQFQTFEVFHQARRGEHHVHVGPVHAPNAELALLFAKEQYGRRMEVVNIWVVPTEAILRTALEDEDMFAVNSGFDKSYREASAYRNRERIEDFKVRSNKLLDVDLKDRVKQPEGTAQSISQEEFAGKWVVPSTEIRKPAGDWARSQPRILLRKEK
jgi:ring-1,2-phenylacetyl-CoA epoxidase subunit PaaB